MITLCQPILSQNSGRKWLQSLGEEMGATKGSEECEALQLHLPTVPLGDQHGHGSIKHFILLFPVWGHRVCFLVNSETFSLKRYWIP